MYLYDWFWNATMLIRNNTCIEIRYYSKYLLDINLDVDIDPIFQNTWLRIPTKSVY